MTDVPGLYFLGLPWQRRGSSGGRHFEAGGAVLTLPADAVAELDAI